jgi:TetR/AcrR family tetracycline transcriptional repressor
MGRRVAPQLDRERLIAASFAVVERHGLENLSMRRVAAQLGVQAPAIYWHVADKAELLGLMAREIYGVAYASVPDAANWREWLAQFGHALRASFSGHRDGARICAIATPVPHADPVKSAQTIAAPLIAFGLDRHSALIFQAAVISYALGWSTFEANGPMHDFLDRMMIFEESFRIGLEAMIAGFVPMDGRGTG